MSTREPLGAPGPSWGEAAPEPGPATRPSPEPGLATGPSPAPGPASWPSPVATPALSGMPVATASSAPIGLECAGPGRRLTGLLVDGIVFVVLLMVLFAVLSSVATIDQEAFEAGDAAAEERVGAVLGALAIAALGYGWLLNAIGWSPGKQALGLRLVRLDGQPPGLGAGFARTVCWPLSVALLGLGLLWPLFDRNRQAWHDKLAATYVVRRPS